MRVVIVAVVMGGMSVGTAELGSQSARDANPERPTFATHAYMVAPGFVEVEQGLSARGVSSLREATTWDVNLKLGVAPHVQAAFFGPLYARGRGGGGVGDLGMALKLGNDVSNHAALAAGSSLTVPPGSTAPGRGAAVVHVALRRAWVRTPWGHTRGVPIQRRRRGSATGRDPGRGDFPHCELGGRGCGGSDSHRSGDAAPGIPGADDQPRAHVSVSPAPRPAARSVHATLRTHV